MKYPRIIIDLKKIENNIEQIVRITKRESGCTTLALVTKGHCADPEIVKLLAKNPEVDFLADSRIENIKKNKVPNLKYMTGNIPFDKLDETIEYFATAPELLRIGKNRYLTLIQ